MVIHHGDLDHGRLFKIRPNGSGKTELEQTCSRRLSGRRVPGLVDHWPDRLRSNPVSFADGSDRLPRDLRDAADGTGPARSRNGGRIHP